MDKKVEVERKVEFPDKMTFKIFDCPIEVGNQAIALAKLYYDNQVWKVFEEGVSLVKNQKVVDLKGLDEKITKLTEEVVQLQNEVDKFKISEEDIGIPTFGGKVKKKVGGKSNE